MLTAYGFAYDCPRLITRCRPWAQSTSVGCVLVDGRGEHNPDPPDHVSRSTRRPDGRPHVLQCSAMTDAGAARIRGREMGADSV